ncbi:unnamed protein product, partial [Ectocarpus sp. 12 AP-2014]
SFGIPGPNRAKFCTNCKPDGMVNFRYNGYPCHVEGCKKTGSFGFAAGRALLCGYHKTDGMISGRKCVEPGC